MIFFGIDPGTAVTGYGVIKTVNNSVIWLDSGVINTRPESQLPDRLEFIYNSLLRKMDEFSPDRVSIEEAFYGKNIHTTLVLGHARGAAMLAAVKSGAKVFEYSPREVKKAVSGNGNASKDQVIYMVKMLLSVPETQTKSDAFDALGLALCDFYHSGPSIKINR